MRIHCKIFIDFLWIQGLMGKGPTVESFSLVSLSLSMFQSGHDMLPLSHTGLCHPHSGPRHTHFSFPKGHCLQVETHKKNFISYNCGKCSAGKTQRAVRFPNSKTYQGHVRLRPHWILTSGEDYGKIQKVVGRSQPGEGSWWGKGITQVMGTADAKIMRWEGIWNIGETKGRSE